MRVRYDVYNKIISRSVRRIYSNSPTDKVTAAAAAVAVADNSSRRRP